MANKQRAAPKKRAAQIEALNIWIPVDLKDRLRRVAKVERRSMTAVAELALERYVDMRLPESMDLPAPKKT